MEFSGIRQHLLLNKQKSVLQCPPKSNTRIVSPQCSLLITLFFLQNPLSFKTRWKLLVTSFWLHPKVQLLLQITEENSSPLFRRVLSWLALMLPQWLSPAAVAPHVSLAVLFLAITQEYQQLVAHSLAEKYTDNSEALSFYSGYRSYGRDTVSYEVYSLPFKQKKSQIRYVVHQWDSLPLLTSGSTQAMITLTFLNAPPYLFYEIHFSPLQLTPSCSLSICSRWDPRGRWSVIFNGMDIQKPQLCFLVREVKH